jgi:ribA/ribD-fused uncharacterized protein
MITSFIGKYFFLSNFYPCQVLYEGIEYDSTEHAFVAAKSDDIRDREYIATIPTAGKAKQYGRRLILRPGWDSMRVQIMRDIVSIKFASHDYLSSALLDTGEEELVEGNYWDDTFWGQCPVGVGENNLGKILMEIRSEKLHSLPR